MSDVPEYFDQTFDPVGDGFMFSATPPSELSSTGMLHSDNPWEVLGHCLLRLRQGDFSVFSTIIGVLERHDEMLLGLSVGKLFAHAAPRSVIPLLRRCYMREELSKHPELVRQYCEILCHSLIPEHLDEVLGWYTITREGWVWADVPSYLSHVWEDEPGPIKAGPQLVPDPQYPPPFEQKIRDYEGYERVVREAAARVDPSARYVLGGAPFSVVGLAKRMIAHSRAGEDSLRTSFERMVFEANRMSLRMVSSSVMVKRLSLYVPQKVHLLWEQPSVTWSRML